MSQLSIDLLTKYLNLRRTHYCVSNVGHHVKNKRFPSKPGAEASKAHAAMMLEAIAGIAGLR